MTSRYTRDEIISQGIELSASATIIQHDLGGGLVSPNAYSIKWLQNALDMFHKRYPFSSDVQSVALTIPMNSYDAYLTSDSNKYRPTDYMIDVRDGIVCNIRNQSYRLKRLSFQYWLNNTVRNTLQTTTQPTIYCTVNNRFKVAPLLTQAQAATLWYYALPTLLDANDIPNFPDEWVLIEFVRLKALEWTRSIEPGTAQVYMTKELARLRSTGLLDDTEYEVIPLENNQVIPDGALVNRNAWMGNYAI